MIRRWLRWWRRRRHLGQARVLACIALLLIVDQMLKFSYAPPFWAWHTQPDSWRYSALPVVFLCFPFLWSSLTALPAALIFAGSLGNIISSFDDRGVANPFQIGTWAFNASDVWIYAGLVAVIATTLRPIASLAFRLQAGEVRP